jgi:mono/diheme cytochrome c family protein
MRKLVIIVLASAFVSPALSFAAQEQAEAAKLFNADCAMCHGRDAAGQTPVGKQFNIPDLRAAAVQKQTDAALAQVIEQGKQKMPAFQSRLNQEQVSDLVKYIRALGKQTPAAK